MLRLLVVTHVPFSRVAALVTRGGKKIGEHGLVLERCGRRRLTLGRVFNGLTGQEVLNSMLSWNAAGEQSRATRGTGRRAHEMILKADARLRKLIDVGRTDFLVAVDAEHPERQTVG